jgi:phenylpropionate dioxygenase-like ring-hydroxylating dioxygenase large terminal subunit
VSPQGAFVNKVDKIPGVMTYGVEAYLSPDYARAERDKLWRKVWQQAGRVEDLVNVGDYITYDVMDDSILIVRTAPDKLSAYHNVCQHRGRRLVDAPKGELIACGKAKQFVCGFHGWRWNLDGDNIYVLDKDDWKGALTDERIKLKPVNVGTWGGWVFINMDLNCEPLMDYLKPVTGMLDPYELDKMRYRWRRWVVCDCNWKVGFEAFLEGYHFLGTHPEFLKFADFSSECRSHGRHSNSLPRASKNAADADALIQVGRGDPREMMIEMQNLYMQGMNAVTTETLLNAAARLVDELPKGTPAGQVMKYWLDSARRDDAARGVVWPTISPEHIAECGGSWTVFPNLKIIQTQITAVCHSFRPYGADPNKCIYESVALERFPANAVPKTEWLHTAVDDPAWLSVLQQDFSNMAAVQQGMKSAGFSGPRPNPVQEESVRHFHQTLADYIGTGAPYPLA